MKMLVFCLRDSAAECYLEPRYARTRAEIIRSLAEAVKSADSDLGRHSEHFSLFEIGSWDSDTGLVSSHLSPVLVINAWELKPGSVALEAVN